MEGETPGPVQGLTELVRLCDAISEHRLPETGGEAVCYLEIRDIQGDLVESLHRTVTEEELQGVAAENVGMDEVRREQLEALGYAGD